MTAPVKQKTWTISANQRIPIVSYATLVLQGGRYLKIIADTLLAHGYTCKGSCNGTTGAMDGVNRWTTDAAASVQAANTTTAVSWMVLTDGNGCNIVLSFVGATGDIARISFSASGVTVAAGTATFTPTSADEIVLFTGVSLITNSTVNDRVVQVWTDSQAKLMRTTVFSAGVQANGTWGVELVNSRTTITFSPAVWGFAFIGTSLGLSNGSFYNGYVVNSTGGQARINGTTVNLSPGGEAYNAGSYQIFAGSPKPPLQKGIGGAMFPIGIGTTTATRQGLAATLYDWWSGKSMGNVSFLGDVVFPGGNWVQIGDTSSGGVVWPWDGATIPQTA
jgi:hypothetical protein